MTAELPRSATLAWWLTAWLRGHEPSDHVLDALSDEAHVLDDTGTLVDLLAAARAAGTAGAGLALPVEGDPVGLGGPRAFNDATLEAGEAVVVGTNGFVPTLSGEVVLWRTYEAARRPLDDVGEADRGLRTALLEAAGDLAELDVARWRPEVADELSNLHHRPVMDPPAGTPARCVELASRGLQARAIVELALQDDGGALTSHEAERRREALQPLARAARRALVAACSSEVWPD